MPLIIEIQDANKGAAFIHGLHKVPELWIVDHSKSTEEQGLSKPLLWGKTNYICAVKRASYFSPDKQGDKDDLLSVEVDGRGFLRILFLLLLLCFPFFPPLLHVRPHSLTETFNLDTCQMSTAEARRAKGSGGDMLLRRASSCVHLSLFPVLHFIDGV